MIGPLQLLVIGFDEDKYAKEIMVELKSLRKEKIIRLFDLLYIIKHQDGTVVSKEVDDLMADEQRTYGGLVKSLLGMATDDLEHVDADAMAQSLASAEGEFGLSEDEIQGLADQIPNGSSAILVIFEHAWARGVREAMLNAGGYVRAQGIINPDTLVAASNQLASVLEAVEKAEYTTMEKMAGVMADVQSQEEEARSRAAETVAEAEAIEAAAMAALAAAQQKEQEAAQAVAESEARVEAAQKRAAEVAAEAERMEDEAFAQAEAVRRAAKRQEEQAVAQAAEAVKGAEQVEAAAVLRAMNAMIAANIIERQSVREALQAVIDADVIEASAARAAAKTLTTG